MRTILIYHLKRRSGGIIHNTRDKKQEFGEEDMRRWWREKDFSSVFNEKIITSDIDADSIVEMIYIDSANEG